MQRTRRKGAEHARLAGAARPARAARAQGWRGGPSRRRARPPGASAPSPPRPPGPRPQPAQAPAGSRALILRTPRWAVERREAHRGRRLRGAVGLRLPAAHSSNARAAASLDPTRRQLTRQGGVPVRPRPRASASEVVVSGSQPGARAVGLRPSPLSAVLPLTEFKEASACIPNTRG